MIKNQHLLGALVVLGIVNLLAFLGLISGERDSARLCKNLERDVAAERDEHRRDKEERTHQVRELQQKLEDAGAMIGQLRADIEKIEARLVKTRRALEAVEERLEKPAPPAGKEAGR